MTDSPVRLIDRRIEYDGVFRLDTIHLEHRRHEGGWTEPMRREVFVLPQAAAVLAYDPAADRVVLIEQFRAGTWAAGAAPWLVEVVAGFVDDGETPEQAARREAMEEAAIELGPLEKIASFCPSPGASAEIIHLYYATCTAPDAETVQGLAEEHEDIRVFTLPPDEAYRRVAEAEPANATALIALQWLMLHRDRLRGGG
jgi:ADP-ribose pyrophosphatase